MLILLFLLAGLAVITFVFFWYAQKIEGYGRADRRGRYYWDLIGRGLAIISY